MDNMLLRATESIGDQYKPNKFGHDAAHPRLIVRSSPYKDGTAEDEFGHRRKSHAVYGMTDKIREFVHTPRYFQDIGYSPSSRYVAKHDGYMQQKRSDFREKLANVAIYLIHHTDYISGKVGIRMHGAQGQFKCFDRDHAVKTTGMTPDAIKVACRWFEEQGMLDRQRIWVDKGDGSYGGRPSIYRLTDEFWTKFRIFDLYTGLKNFYYSDALKKVANNIKKLARGLSCATPDIAQPIENLLKRKQKAKPADFPMDDIRHWLTQLPAKRHNEFQIMAAGLLYAEGQDGLHTKAEAFAIAHKAIKAF